LIGWITQPKQNAGFGPAFFVLSSSSTVIVRECGRSSVPETSAIQPRGRGVLDARRSLSSGAHSRDPVAGMTAEVI
jgi:hypothetical protein